MEIDIPILLFIPFTIFVMLATTNAVNLTDGIDGLRSFDIDDHNCIFNSCSDKIWCV